METDNFVWVVFGIGLGVILLFAPTEFGGDDLRREILSQLARANTFLFGIAQRAAEAIQRVF